MQEPENNMQKVFKEQHLHRNDAQEGLFWGTSCDIAIPSVSIN